MAIMPLVFRLFLLALLTISVAGAPWIDPRIQASSSILISMRAGTNGALNHISSAANAGTFTNIADRRVALHFALLRNAEDSQTSLLKVLKGWEPALEITSFWITNQIHIRNAPSSILGILRDRDDVVRVEVDEPIQLPATRAKGSSNHAAVMRSSKSSIAYNLRLIGVEEVWAAGVNGTGVVIGSLSTGVRVTHEALRSSYRDDGHSWFNALTPIQSPQPFDDLGVGTLELGVSVGGGGVGVAPGAQWLTCKAFDNNGSGSLTSITRCGEFMLTPWRPDRSDPDPERAPHVVITSFLVSNTANIPSYESLFRAWREGGIIHVTHSSIAAGEPEEAPPACSSITYTGWSNWAISVGATDVEDRLASYSGVGPSPTPGAPLKPDLTAPGVNVLGPTHSADDCYGSWPPSEAPTIAGAHVAGVVALILGEVPQLTYEQVKQVLRVTASKELKDAGLSCGGVSDSQFPNFHFGAGRLDALGAVMCVREGLSCIASSSPSTPISITTVTERDEESEEVAPSWLLFLTLTLASLALLTFCTLVLVWWRRRSRRSSHALVLDPTTSEGKASRPSSAALPLQSILNQFRAGVLPLSWCSVDLEGRGGVANPQRPSGNYLALTTPYDAGQYELNANSVRLDPSGQVFGTGQFSVVHPGLLFKQGSLGSPLHVAVKRPKMSGPDKSQCHVTGGASITRLLKELQILIHVGPHTNIVGLLGAVTVDLDRVSIVLEVCVNRDLEGYLRAVRRLVDTSSSEAEIRKAKLFQWTTQIASGMEFLAERRVVHGDLAARNVLLDEHLIVKISDFGLAALLSHYSAYVRSEERQLPWRWMALESLKDMRFSTASDVWSFGVTAWEVFSLAQTPYPNTLWSPAFVQELESGLRNPKPEFSTEEAYKLLTECWRSDPKDRPTISQIKETLTKLNTKCAEGSFELE